MSLKLKTRFACVLYMNVNVFSGRKENPFTETLFAFVVTFLFHASKEAFQWLFRKCDIFEELGVLAIKKKLTSRTARNLK